MTRSTAVGAVALVLCAVPLTACGGKSTGGGGTAGPSPAGLSRAAYQSALRKNLAPLNTAIAAVDKAADAKSLDTALRTAAGKAKSAGTTLSGLQAKVPADARAAHMDLAFQLGGLANIFSGARDTGSRCSRPPRVALGNAGPHNPAQKDLKTLAAQGYRATLRTPHSKEQKTSRPADGALVDDNGTRTGAGLLVIKNGTDTDGAVTLTAGTKKPVFTVYVRASSTARVSGVRDDQYTVYFTTGEDWSQEKRSFTSNCSFQEFIEPVFFITGNGKSTVQTYTLHKVENGNAATGEVNEGSYPY